MSAVLPIVLFCVAAPQEPGLLAWWPLDGALADATGHGHDAGGTQPAYATGNSGQAYRGGTPLNVPSHPDLQLAPGLLLDCWVMFPERPQGYETLILKDAEYQLRVDGPNEGGRFSFFVYLSGWEPRISGPVPEPGKWHHVVAGWSGASTFLEVDGERKQAARQGVAVATDNALELGRCSGYLDEVKLLNPTLVTQRELLALPAGEALNQPTFGGALGWAGWGGLLGGSASVAGGDLTARLPDGAALVSPPLAVPLAGRRTVSLDLGPGEGHALLSFVTDQGAGSASVPLWPDGRTSFVTPADSPVWHGTLKRLALSFPGREQQVTLHGLWLAAEPQGRPFVYVRSLAPGRAILRSGREEQLIAAVRSLGAAATGLEATVSVPAGVALLDPVTQPLHDLPYGTLAPVRWRIRADQPVTGQATVNVRWSDGRSAPATTDLRFEAPVDGPAATYVPPPQPVRSPWLTLMHYCPLWKEGTHYGWERIEPWPERRPAIGWYDEGTPEVADWQIKYALEHGIQGFIYCWYRADKSPEIHENLGHAIHDGLLHARYLDQFKFTIMWENGCGVGCTNSDDLMTNLFPYWMANFFKQPSYVKIDNKPLLYIWVPGNVTRDLGGSANVRKVFDQMREACRKEGFDGLYIVGCVGSADPVQLERMKEEGWDASSAYGQWGPTTSPPGRDIEGIETRSAAESVVNEAQIWRGKKAIGALPDIIDIMQGWDPRPWHGDGTTSYYAGASPADFEKACREARALLEATTGNGLDRRVVVFDNWCEFGEGHYLEPCVGYGFGYLDAIKRVFCDDAPPCHDVIPEDVGLAPPEHVYLARRELLGGWADRPREVRDHLLGWWTFDDGDDVSMARDSSACGFHGLKQDFVSGEGRVGRAFVCTGGSVSVQPHRLLQPADGLTIALWCRTDTPEQSDRWMLNTISSANTGYRLGLGNGKLCFQVPKTDWSHSLSAPAPLPLNQWVYVAATYDGRTMRLYQDGVEVAHLDRGGPVQAASGGLAIGDYAPGHPRAWFKGSLDEVRLYDRPLSAAEIAGLMRLR